MGKRKRISSEKIKEKNKNLAFAKLNNSPISDRKMSLVARLIRGKEVEKAINILDYTNKAASEPLKKLVLSAVANWEAKNSDKNIEQTKLFIDSLIVTKGKMLKRIQPAPQGRAHRIRKRSNHVYISIAEKE